MTLAPPLQSNTLAHPDRAFHDWYRFVLSFPPHLVRAYLEKMGAHANAVILDPFCGTGTTLVEAKKLGMSSIGIEANPVAHFASRVKVDWSVVPEALWETALKTANSALLEFQSEGLNDDFLFNSDQAAAFAATHDLKTLSDDEQMLVLHHSISPLPLHKVLTLRDHIVRTGDARFSAHLLLALATMTIKSASNLHFGPEVGVKGSKADVSVISAWLALVRAMVDDLVEYQSGASISSTVHHTDARMINSALTDTSVDVVFTSPPYPNEKDYTRTTRLEMVLLGFIHDRASLQAIKKGLLRSNTRGVYKEDRDDLLTVTYPRIQALVDAIEQRRLDLGKTSGFERLYGRVTKLYFGGMVRHLTSLKTGLRPGAKLGYVVGDQASYFRVLIPTGELLAEIADSLGYRVTNIDLFRTRFSTATGEHLKEEVVLLEWKGGNS